MNSCPVTVLMSVYNAETYLRESIQSILCQTFSDFEFIIINDCSTDQSREIVESYDDPRIRMIDNIDNIGLTRSLNKGLQESLGEFIVRHDADDIAVPDRIAKQFECFQKNQRLGLLGGWYLPFNEKNGIQKKIPPSSEPIVLRWNLLFRNRFGHSTVMVRTEACRQEGGYDESFSLNQDYDLWSKIAKSWDIDIIPQLLCYRRIELKEIPELTYSPTTAKTPASIISIRNLLDLTQERLKEDECMFLHCLLGARQLPAEAKIVLKNISIIKTVIKIFTKKYGDKGSQEKIKAECIDRILNFISPAYSLRHNCCVIYLLLVLSPGRALSGVFSKIMRCLHAR